MNERLAKLHFMEFRQNELKDIQRQGLDNILIELNKDFQESQKLEVWTRYKIRFAHLANWINALNKIK